MNSETGRFEVVNLAEPERERPSRPTLAVGEIISIKGVDFVITRIKADGKIGLRMIAKGPLPPLSPGEIVGKVTVADGVAIVEAA